MKEAQKRKTSYFCITKKQCFIDIVYVSAHSLLEQYTI